MTAPIPILYLVGGFQMGGTERHLSLLLPRLDRARWSPSVICLGGDGPFSEPLRAAGIEIAPLAVSPAWQGVPKLRVLTALLAQVRAARREVARIRPAIVHCFLPGPCIVGGLALPGRGRRRARLVMSRRSQDAGLRAYPGELRVERWALRRADRVLGHSAAVVAELAAAGVAADRLALLPNGIDAAAFSPAATSRAQLRAQRGWAPDEVVLVCVANLIPYKGHGALIEAMTSVDGVWRLLLVGAGEPGYVERLRALAARVGLAGRIEFFGRRNDLQDWLAACDIGVLASEHEGFSNAVLEYMAAALPVVATAVGGNADAVANGDTGVLVAPGDAVALGRALAALLHDGAARQRLGAAGRQRVMRDYDLDAIVARYEALYSELCDG